ncbi:hypothetical protein [Paludisphaera sp.]|uniref:hypothetical protein n=1 Tax=Paludisphaera sp. TaxID=2017432 RepID=UPI00301E2823
MSAPGHGVARARMTAAATGGTFGDPSRSGRAVLLRNVAGRWVATGEEVEVVHDHEPPVPAGARVALAFVRGEYHIVARSFE